MLLVSADGLSSRALSLVESAQVERAMVVGDPSGIPQATLSVLDKLGILVERVAGQDVYGTAAAAGRFADPGHATPARAETAIVVSDADPAGATAATPLAAGRSVPVLVTSAEELHPSTAGFIADNEISRVLLVGSTTEFSSEVALAIEAAGADVVRIVGETPQDLALTAGDYFEDVYLRDPRCTAGPRRFAVVPAGQARMALAAVPLLAHLCTALSYTDDGQLSPQTRNDIYLARHSPRGAQVHVFADADRISDSTVDIVLPPIRLAFPVTDPTLPGTNNTMAVIDEQRHVTLHLQGEGFSGINWLAWSPNAPRLAFAAKQAGTAGLFLLEPDSGAARRLTPPDRTLWLSTWAPAQWSPTGTHLAMSAYEDPDGNYHGTDADLYVIGVDSGNFTELSTSEDHDQFMYWNPAGDRILFLRHDQFGLPLGWMPNRDRAFLANITDSTVTELDLDGQALWYAQWSPDSSLIAMALVDDDRSQNGGLGPPRIQLVSSDRMPFVAADGYLADGYVLGWSADGSLLAVSQVLSDGADYERRIATVDAGGQELTELTELPGLSPDEHLRFWSWAPDHNALLFDRYDSEVHRTGSLLLVDAEQHSLLRLPGPIEQAEYRPFDFSPDGEQIGSMVYADVWLIVATDTRTGGSERLLLDVTEYRGQRTEQWADVRFLWNHHGLSGTIEWYADY
ncbi:cell wall-binding repeat-containing protein [Candidatus Poriferisodalis sp.]|uniref:cell wall-binding repeat-containing protein n=1 Tax=Candidatus Poriferisodalis sp. TaxID=3101277 RepID=UPI003B59287E